MDGGELKFTPAADENGAGYASFTFKVSDGTEESAATYTMTVDVTAVNDAGGADDQRRGARDAECVADGDRDVDGLPGNESGYASGCRWTAEWRRRSPTSRTYEVVTADEGKKLKEVS